MAIQISAEQSNAEELLCRQVKSLLLMGVNPATITTQVELTINELKDQCRCKHTPGPWEVLSAANFQNEIVSDGGNGRVVAILDKSDGEDEANALLIAAAPDLLSACMQVLRLLGSDDEASQGRGSPDEVAQDLRDAIAKAMLGF